MNIYMKNLFAITHLHVGHIYGFLTISLSVFASVLRGKRLYLSDWIFSYAYTC